MGLMNDAMPTAALSDALFTKAQQKVLALLFGRADKSFYLNEVVRYADMGKGSISRELAKFAEAGLLTVIKQGNQNHYRANQQCPIFLELKQIALKTFGIKEQLRQAIDPISSQLQQAFIYGSVAKGEAHSNSDVDLMLVGYELSYSGVMELLEVAEQQLQRQVNPTIYTPEEFSSRLQGKQNFLKKVTEQPKINLLG